MAETTRKRKEYRPPSHGRRVQTREERRIDGTHPHRTKHRRSDGVLTFTQHYLSCFETNNIGFDKDDILKSFDFGLAKQLKPTVKRTDGRYQLTGNTVGCIITEMKSSNPALKMKHVLTITVSFFVNVTGKSPLHGTGSCQRSSLQSVRGRLLLRYYVVRVLYGRKAFFGYSGNKHMQQVVIAGERPKMDSHHTQFWPANLQWLMSHCWSAFPIARPSFSVIKQVLLDVLDGKETIPKSLIAIDSATMEDNSSCSDDEPALSEPPTSGMFSAMFNPLRKSRSKSNEATSPEPPSPGRIKRPSANKPRSRT
jgi:hypothetical protein